MGTDQPVTLVTGSRKGLGRFLAERLLAQGHIVIGCSRSAAGWQHENYHHFEMDVCDEGAARRVFSEIRKRFRRLDHLVNNAGVASMNHCMLTPLDIVRHVFETNVYGTFVFCREAAKLMRGTGGRIVNFSTVAVPLRLEGEAIYAASKGAVEILTRVLAKELGPFDITVNAVAPTPIDTDLIRNVPKEKIQAILDQQAIHRMATAEDVANVVDFFMDPASGFVTGQILYLGGLG
jgi:3-oxoacyl-[acyl-carrier protein] reductase